MSENNPQIWLDIAEDDLGSARKLAAPPDPHWKAAVYHCQQAAEKAIKALLVCNSFGLQLGISSTKEAKSNITTRGSAGKELRS